MPRYASNADEHADRNAGEWIIIADSEVDDINAWRNAPYEQHYVPGGWPALPDEFFHCTNHLTGHITAHFPRLDPTPLSDLYETVACWHREHCASHLPPQNVLYSRFERAVIVLNAVRAAIYDRAVPSQTTQPTLPKLTENEQVALNYIKENGPVGGKMIALHVGVVFSTFRRWVSQGGNLLAHGVRNDRNKDGYYVPKSM